MNSRCEMEHALPENVSLNEPVEAMDTEDSFACITPMDTNPIVSTTGQSEENVVTSISSAEDDDFQTQFRSFSKGDGTNMDKKLCHQSPNTEKSESENKKDSACSLTGLKGSVENNEDFSIDNKKKNSALTDEKKIANLRKNIRDVMGENQLDSNTIEAQREESERLARVAEQQKIIREYQRQTAVNKQNVRTKNRVISLLQSGTTFAKITDVTEESQQEKVLRDYYGPIVNSNKLADKDVKDDGAEKSNKCNSKAIYTPELPINDIVTIEDSSSEDDCILLSDDEENDLEEETEDDPNNSGLHVKDVYNVADEEGRVVVNVGHPQGEEDIFIAPQIAKIIKPHQIGGVRFLFDNVIESTKRFNSSTGFGCILAHSMGLGKTLQVVCFCDIILRHTDSKTILCVMPINTLQNWMSEFDMWLPKQSDNPGNVRPRTFNVFVLNDQQKTLSARGKVILKWAEEGGVLLMGYELFRLLALKLIPNRKRKVGKTSMGIEKVETEAHKRLSESIYQALVKPGPDLVICDEGHRIKNSHAGISLALKQMRTRRRIVLTGYPLQNNLLEYWCMVDFVRPNYLGTRTEFSNMFERPIQNGQCIDSTPEDIKFMRYRAHVLHSLLVGFVQRRSHLVLEHTLPQKLEYVILTKMTSFQRKLYETFMNDVVRKKTVPNPLKAFAVCCKIWNHPDVLYNFLKKRETELDLEIDDVDGSADISASLKGNLKKNEKVALSPESENNKSEKLDIGSLQKVNDCKAQELKNANSKESHCYDYLSQNNYQFSQAGLFSSESSESSFWQDPNATYYGYPSLCSNMGSPIRPDYVGMVVKKTNEQENTNSSSQIVDLDTKEIKTVETDIDITISQVVNNVSYHAKKPLFSNNAEKSSETFSSGPNSIKSNVVLESSNNECLVESIDKETFKAKGDDGIPYDWAIDLMKGYEPILVCNSPKMQIFLCILNESIKKGDRVLLFSQSLLTLNLIENFLQLTLIPTTNKCWAKNESYFRLDGSTSSQEREKLVNEFNSNPDLLLFLISTKAGSLGINLVGANRVVVFDASWNPCHDTQAVYRIYRYGQQKPCFVYRIVMDKCLEKKIYDRQVKKQGMSNRVVDECNPDAHLSMKDVTNLCYDYDNDQKQSNIEFAKPIDSYSDVIIQKMLSEYKDALSKEPFYHESLLVDRKEKKLSVAEKRQAQRSYEMEKKAASKQVFNYHTNKLQYRIFRNDGSVITRPVASVRPMQTAKSQNLLKTSPIRSTRWIPAEVWQRQGMTAQEMTLPLDVVIPTNSSDKTNIILKSGQRVMVLKSPKGIYMQLESGKIIAIRTSSKMNQPVKSDKDNVIDITAESSILSNKNCSARDNKDSKSGHSSATSTITVKEIGSVKPNVKQLFNDKKEKNKMVIIEENDLNPWADSKKDAPQALSQKVLKSVLIQRKPTPYQDLSFNKGTTRKAYADGNQRTNEKSAIDKNTAQNTFSNVAKLSLSTNLEQLRGSETHVSEIPEKKPVQSPSYGCTDKYADKETDIFQPRTFSDADDVKNFCDDKTEDLNNDTQDQTKLQYMRKDTSQCLSVQERSPQSSLNQHYSHQPPITQQKEPYASEYNSQVSNYSSKPPQVCVDNVPPNAYVPNQESLQHTQFFDSMYDNGVTSTYEHPHRFPNYSTNGSYTSFQQHFHPHFHNLGSIQSSSIGTHPYYMRWPPMSTISHPPNQHSPMYSSPYSPNDSSSYQWHNQR